MNTVDRIWSLCEERGIAIARMEKACGFANGYIKKLSGDNIPAGRLLKVAEYLDVEPMYLLTGKGLMTPDGVLRSLSDEEKDLLYLFRTFNPDGRKEVLKRITEMSFIPAYREDLSQKSYPSQSVG